MSFLLLSHIFLAIHRVYIASTHLYAQPLFPLRSNRHPLLSTQLPSPPLFFRSTSSQLTCIHSPSPPHQLARNPSVMTFFGSFFFGRLLWSLFYRSQSFRSSIHLHPSIESSSLLSFDSPLTLDAASEKLDWLVDSFVLFLFFSFF